MAVTPRISIILKTEKRNKVDQRLQFELKFPGESYKKKTNTLLTTCDRIKVKWK
ncbi:14571_t:CDS:2 [Rhizophagus irregularis]|nr:14571_t:CDS:2 [Rhizophagus irregularis]